jgi:hypothetical protein
MRAKKDNQAEVIIIETTAWILVVGIVYMVAKLLF